MLIKSMRPAAQSRRFTIARLALGPCLLAASLSGALVVSAAQAQSMATQQINYDIAAGSLDQVLNRFAARGGFILAIDASLTEGKTSPGLKGAYLPQQGLRQILQGSGLEAVVDGTGYRLRAAPGLSTRSHEELEAVRVQAKRESATGPANGLLATRSATATKSDAAIMDTPASVSVVTQQQIESPGDSHRG